MNNTIENLKIFKDNLTQVRKNHYIDVAFKLFTKQEIYKFNTSLYVNTKKTGKKKYSAFDIKCEAMNFGYFNKEEEGELVKILYIVNLIQERYLNDECTYEEALEEVNSIKHRFELQKQDKKPYIKKK